MKLTSDQQKVADTFMKFLRDPDVHEMVIEGFPGTGKSFLTKYLINLTNKSTQLVRLLTSDETSGIRIYCTATTNKAAVVLEELSGEKTQTIHSLLRLKVMNNFSTGASSLKKTDSWKPVENALIIIDEYTYIDKPLLKIIRDSAHNCKILFIGDKYQLISIHDTYNPVTHTVKLKGVLNQSIRFANNSPIDLLAAQLRETIDTGIFKPIKYDDSTIIHVDGIGFQNRINNEFVDKKRLPTDAKIIAWSNKKVHEYNNYIRSKITSSEFYEINENLITNKPIIGANKKGTLYSTEATIHITNVKAGNEYGINGHWLTLLDDTKIFQANDLFQVKSLLNQQAKVSKKSNDWKLYFILKDFFSDLRPTHSCTVHKSQGSTYKKVFVDLTDIGKCSQPETVARMLHVAITRASDQVICYGQLPDKYSGG